MSGGIYVLYYHMQVYQYNIPIALILYGLIVLLWLYSLGTQLGGGDGDVEGVASVSKQFNQKECFL